MGEDEKGVLQSGSVMSLGGPWIYDPAYLNYTLVKLMIRRLRNDWVRTHSGRDWKTFYAAS